MAPRECWMNVYSDSARLGVWHTSRKCRSPQEAKHYRGTSGMKAVCVLRVKLKPPGAPARYSSEHDRRNWEQYPEEMRQCPF